MVKPSKTVVITPKFMTETPSTVRYDGHKMGNSRNVKPGTARRWWPNYLSGLLSLLAGLAIVNLHNTWRADWRVIITVLGWLMTIGGIKYPSSADAGQGARRLSGLSGVVSVSGLNRIVKAALFFSRCMVSPDPNDRLSAKLPWRGRGL
jgi:hypothetical protein